MFLKDYALEIVAVEGIFSLFYGEQRFQNTRLGSAKMITFLVGYFALYLLPRVGNNWIFPCGFLMINLLLFRLNYRLSWSRAAIHSCALCFLNLLSKVSLILAFGLYGYDAPTAINFPVMERICYWHEGVYGVLSLIVMRWLLPPRAENEEGEPPLFLCLLPLLSSAALLLLFEMGENLPYSAATNTVVAIAVGTMVCANGLLVWLYRFLRKHSEEQFKNQLTIQKEQADVLYYTTLQNQADSQRILIHDIKNHLRTIDALAQERKNGELSNYIHQLDHTISRIPKAKLCTEPILNALLLRFGEDCDREKVAFQCDVRDDCLGFMDEVSITSLFGNLLSNALEAAIRSERRCIELTVKQDMAQRAVLISVVNSCNEAPILDGNGRPVTNKADKKLHGIGMKSIRRTVSKYNGISAVKYDPEEMEFHHVIRLSESI